MEREEKKWLEKKKWGLRSENAIRNRLEEYKTTLREHRDTMTDSAITEWEAGVAVLKWVLNDKPLGMR